MWGTGKFILYTSPRAEFVWRIEFVVIFYRGVPGAPGAPPGARGYLGTLLSGSRGALCTAVQPDMPGLINLPYIQNDV